MSSDASLYGECRFCLALGEHQEVMKEYLNGDCREVYYDMFLECFNVFLITPRGANLICKGCVARLRDANSFRNMVVNAEKELQAACQRYQIEPVEVPPEIKYELVTDVKVEEAQELVDVQSDNPELVDVQSDNPELVDVQSDNPEFVDVQSDNLEFVDVQSDNPELVDVQSDNPELVDVQSDDPELVDDKSDNEVLEDVSDDVVFETVMENNENRSPQQTSSTLKNTKAVTLECDFCFKEFDSKRKLIRHITEHSVEIAEDSLTPDLNLNERHQKDQPENYHALKKRSLSNKARQTYVCKLCGQKFSMLRKLTKHEWNNHTDRHCDVCHKQFQNRVQLNRHKRVHAKDEPYLCDTCGKGYKKKEYLVDHLNKHFGVETYSCEGCKRKFTHGYQKTWHIKKCTAYKKNWYVTTSPERLEKKDYNLRKKNSVTGERSTL